MGIYIFFSSFQHVLFIFRADVLLPWGRAVLMQPHHSQINQCCYSVNSWGKKVILLFPFFKRPSGNLRENVQLEALCFLPSKFPAWRLTGCYLTGSPPVTLFLYLPLPDGSRRALVHVIICWAYHTSSKQPLALTEEGKALNWGAEAFSSVCFSVWTGQHCVIDAECSIRLICSHLPNPTSPHPTSWSPSSPSVLSDLWLYFHTESFGFGLSHGQILLLLGISVNS